MAFRALLFSKSTETNTAITAACQSAGIHVEVGVDIFSAIEKGTKQNFSCVIADWADQPEAGFLLKRTRESASNGDTVAIAIVDHEPRPAELRDNRLDFLIYRPISPEEADAVLARAREKMQPLRADDTAEPAREASVSHESPSSVSVGGDAPERSPRDQSANFPEAHVAEGIGNGGIERDIEGHKREEPRRRGHAIGFRGACAAVLVLAAAFCLWRSRGAIEFLSRTPEGRFRVLRESVAALFPTNKTGALPAGSAGDYPPQDEYFSRDAARSDAQTPALAVVAPESTVPEARIALRKAPDLALPVPDLERQGAAPIHRERQAIPESMRNSPPMERPLVVAVNPALLPVSVAPAQPSIRQSQSTENEPVVVSEPAARALLVHTVNPVYPPEALAQKLHGPVVLQAVIGRDGSVEDLKLVRGYFILGRAAIAAVKQWRFQPYSANGRASATQTVITINFSYPPG